MVVISNNLAYVLFKFELPEDALEHMRNAVGFMVSFITKDRIINGLNSNQGINTDILSKSRRILQRLLLIRLQLRLFFFLNILGKHSEALDATREALHESALVCMDTVAVGLLFAMKMNKIKKAKQIRMLQKEKRSAQLNPDMHDKIVRQGELTVLKKIASTSMGVAEKVPQTYTSHISNEEGTGQVLDNDQRALLNHLEKWLPIAMELKHFIENMNETMKKHKKIVSIDKMFESLKDIHFASLDVSYLHSHFAPSHYLYQNSISDIIKLDLLELKDMDFECDFRLSLHQISSQSLVEKISWLVITYFETAMQKECLENVLKGNKNKFGDPDFSRTVRQVQVDNRVPDS